MDPNARSPTPMPPNHRLLALALLLLFGLLAWGIWWYFAYKIQALDQPPPP